MTKKILAAVLALTAVMTAGCGGSKDNKEKDMSAEVSKGRYVEDKLDFGEIDSVTEFANTAEVQLVDLYRGTENTKIHKLKDGEPTTEDMGANCILEGFDMPQECTLSPNGDLFFSCCNDRFDVRYGIIRAKGEKKQVELPEDIMFTSFEYAPDGRLYGIALNDEDSSFYLYLIDTERSEVTALCDTEYCSTLDIVGDRIYLTDPSGDGIKIYDTVSGKQVEDETLADFWKSSMAGNDGCCDIFGGGDGAVYIVSRNGIYRHVVGGSMVEQVVEGLTNSLGSANNHTMYGTTDTDGSFVIITDEFEVRRYYFDPEAVNEFTSDLDIYTLRESEALMQAVRAFAKLHPEVRVNVRVGMQDNRTYDDAVKSLTTDILSDNAPDLIMLDGLDIQSLEDKGMLTDLNSIRDKWEPSDSVMKNISEWDKEDALSCVAARFGIFGRGAGKEDMERLGSYIDMVKLTEEALEKGEISHAEKLDEENLENRIRYSITLNAGRIFSGGTADKAALAEYFAEEKLLFDNAVMVGGKDYGMWETCSMAAGESCAMEGAFFSAQELLSLTWVDNNSDLVYAFGSGEGKAEFVPVCDLGICAAGDEQDMAAEFIKTALSKDCQKANVNEGMSVDKEVLGEVLQNDSMCSSLGFARSDGSFFAYTISPLEDSELNEFIDFAENADTPVLIDDMTRDIIAEAAMAHLTGDKSADEAAEQAMSGLELKMKE
ncbi:extracellular solute-binding protein [Ruminococcus sp.]|uniref:extracellular solute-binding protein n=1 Tax=Ruminococcus sp. TaxID=41978 RepID=UPI0025FC826D|nr:extracellular solute-binding protein [Ruminococcus sp.]MBQ8966025.1 extracellular solute-binding protein [Ruminococcus sp.]